MSGKDNTKKIGSLNAQTWAKKWKFDLKKYDIIESWGIKEWAEQLTERAFLRRLEAGEVGGMIKEKIPLALKQTLKNIFGKTPLIDIGHFSKEKPSSPPPTLSAHALTIADAIDIGDNSQRFDSYLENSKYANGPLQNLDVAYDVVDWESGKAPRANLIGHLVIDLSAAESQIEKDAMQCVRELRTQYEKLHDPKSAARRAKSKNGRVPVSLPSALYKAKHFKRWYDFCVIPYLDLMLAAKLDGKEFEEPGMATLLFPSEMERDPIDMVRLSTRVYAKQLITPLVLDALNAQATISTK